MTIDFYAIRKPEEWMQTVASQFGKEVVNNSFELPPSIGEGFFKQYEPFPWMTLTYIRFMGYEPLTFVRRPVDYSDWIPVMFYTDELSHEQVIGKKTKNVGIDSLDGIFMPSCHIPSEWNLPAKQWRTNITITFNQQWVKSILPHDKENYIQQILSTDKSFYFFETISPAMLQLLDSIKEIAEKKPPFTELLLHSKSVKLLALFFEKLEKRTSVKAITNLNANDVETVFHIRRQILENLDNVPNIQQLAEEYHMSSSKLQKCFKQVIGKAIAEYALSEKMERAKHLLATRLYTVSEVGYQVGYTNLSHFAKSFRKYHKINPKQYLSSL